MRARVLPLVRILCLAGLAGLAGCGSQSGLWLPAPPGVDESVSDDATDSPEEQAFPLDSTGLPNEPNRWSSEVPDAMTDAPVEPLDVTTADLRVDAEARDVVSEGVAARDATVDVSTIDVTSMDVTSMDVANDVRAEATVVDAKDGDSPLDVVSEDVAPVDATADVTVLDVAVDVAAEADANGDAPEDSLPGLDVVHPGNNHSCDGGYTRIYVITESADILSFDPTTSLFRKMGTISCPGTASFPNSMAVARSGLAYVGSSMAPSSRSEWPRPSASPRPSLSTKAGLRSLEWATCATMRATARRSTSPRRMTLLGWPGSTRVRSCSTSSDPSRWNITTPELTGTGAGQLFAFEAIDNNDSAILEIDKATATVVAESLLTGVERGNAWAFSFWGEAFYTFTRPASSPGSVVARFRPSDGSIVRVAATDEVIVGAGVSTCAP